ncbi:MAG: nucleoside triphosphate pyrophosphohydrolase family protein [Candidatus Paceibacterota bacterium]
MDFNEYQKKSRKTALYPKVGDNLQYLGLGIADEAGEVAGKVKKLMRDHNITSVHDLTDELRTELVKEVGDVLWYIAQIATEVGVELDALAEKNIEKLYSRMDRNTLHGDGDNR